MPTERIAFTEINCSVLADATAADELCEAIICKIEADLGDTEAEGLDPADRQRVDEIVGHVVRMLTSYLSTGESQGVIF